MSTLKIIRYIFILVVYHFIISLIAFCTYQISIIYKFEYSNWSFYQWWFFIATLILVGVFGLYLAPFYDECLETLLERIIIYMKLKKKVDQNKIKDRIKELEAKYKEITEDDKE